VYLYLYINGDVATVAWIIFHSFCSLCNLQNIYFVAQLVVGIDWLGLGSKKQVRTSAFAGLGNENAVVRQANPSVQCRPTIPAKLNHITFVTQTCFNI